LDAFVSKRFVFIAPGRMLLLLYLLFVYYVVGFYCARPFLLLFLGLFFGGWLFLVLTVAFLFLFPPHPTLSLWRGL